MPPKHPLRPNAKPKPSAQRPQPPRLPPPPPAGAEVLYGRHAIRAALLARPADVDRVLVAGKETVYHQDLIAAAHRHDVPIYRVPWPEFLRVGSFTEADSHQGVLAFVRPRPLLTEHDLDRLAGARCVLVLDQLSNPQNLAAILRAAAFFRAGGVVTMKHRAAAATPEVARLAVGGADLVDLFSVTNLAQALDALRDMGFAVLGLDERGAVPLAAVDPGHPTAFVIGAEGEGLRPKTRAHCTGLVRIPGGRPGLESLNAAAAAVLALYEVYRLRAE